MALQNLVEYSINEINEISKSANSIQLSEINKIKKSIKEKKPDDILAILQKSGELMNYFSYWQSRSCLDPNEIKATFQGTDRKIIHVLIDLNILKLISGEASKIIWRDPNIVNPQGTLSIENKKPDWNSQTKTALILGVTKQAVQKLCKDKFKPALNKDGKINLWHPIVQEHKKKIEARKSATKLPTSKPKSNHQPINGKSIASTPTSTGNFNKEITYEEIENLTIKQVVERYGGIIGFKNYVDALDKMAAWKIKEQKFDERRNKLIEKNPVAMSLFSIINIGFKRILEYPDIITDQLIAIAKSNDKTARIDAVNLQTKTLSKILENVKIEVIRDLKKLD